MLKNFPDSPDTIGRLRNDLTTALEILFDPGSDEHGSALGLIIQVRDTLERLTREANL